MVSHPKMKPIMDMTAALLVYTRRLASQVDGSGKVSRNHSWNTGVNLRIPRSITSRGWCYRAYIGRTSFANILPASISSAFLILSNISFNSALCYGGVRLASYHLDTHIPSSFGPLPHTREGGRSAQEPCLKPIEQSRTPH